jgi:predicted nucleotidyltransferase
MMSQSDKHLLPNQQVVMDRFIHACQEDDRVIAAYLSGSYASGTADEYSDLDLALITTDEDFDEFCAHREDFMRRLGEPLYLEDFGSPFTVHYILEEEVEGELNIGRVSQFEQITIGSYQVLLDKRDILRGAVFHGVHPQLSEQTEKLRGLLTGFWHEWLHFTTAVGRGQVWWAQGQLEELRGYCLSLARLSGNFLDEYAGEEPYFKIEKAIAVEQLAVLRSTFGPLEIDHLRESGWVVLRCFRELALPLAQAHGIPYPEALERVMTKRLRGNL